MVREEYIMDGKDMLIRDLKQKVSSLENEVQRIEKENEYLNYCISEIRNSKSYKIGLFVTKLPRALRGIK